MSELELYIKSLQTNKAAGSDGIPTEVWKCGALNEQLLDICNKAFKGDIPNLWLKSNIIPIPKKGDLSKQENYRGIGLMSTAAKVYNKLLLNRLSPHIEPILRTNQNGFRKGRSTTGHILTLRRIFEEIKEINLSAVFTFIDFRKTFDTVKRQKMFKILEAYGVPDEFIQAIAAMYETKAQVITADGESEVFPVSSGVLQGDTLAPYLFIITLDYALRLVTSDHEDLGLTIAKR